MSDNNNPLNPTHRRLSKLRKNRPWRRREKKGKRFYVLPDISRSMESAEKFMNVKIHFFPPNTQCLTQYAYIKDALTENRKLSISITIRLNANTFCCRGARLRTCVFRIVHRYLHYSFFLSVSWEARFAGWLRLFTVEIISRTFVHIFRFSALFRRTDNSRGSPPAMSLFRFDN